MSEKETFRQEVRAWLEENCPASLRTPTPDDELVWGGSQITFKTQDQRVWFERMRDQGWFCPSWPKEYGGGGLDAEQENILEQEIRRLGCRPAQINLGIWMLGPVVLKYGTEEQKHRILTPMTKGEVRWCQGFSEPNAGSDLANIRTTAKEDGDEYVVNGAKIWTSYGNKSDWMYALVRTDSSGSKHHGISLLLIDMHALGVTVSPIDLISGKSSFCEVHFNEVRVSKDNLIGEPNLGWSLAKQLLQHERAAMSKFGEFSLPTHYDLLALSKAYLPKAPSMKTAALQARLITADMEEQAYALTVARMTEEARSGIDVNGTMSIMKLVHTEQEKVKFELLLDVMGYRGLGWDENTFTEQELGVTRAWLNSFTQTIAGGSSEIQLNVIAKRILNLPDASKVDKTQ
ncbi:acyl-CoA dehydrogenase (plasmid) [Vibrio sp. B1REV9]|uniref:acyl-CoA dehydrogenase family protein n=1 Tax=Vibrio sp. B1REV9 TaxID=2751179 RepID=UPI001AED07B4|nr:acyl-CoA dehydrogenase family protein [Vibrio sp. B1REV9]CAE6957581.1 acyl-CoA dehydrogenase [Vibrio sp. B1REV9]